MDGRYEIERWKQHFHQHLNGVENVSVREQTTEGTITPMQQRTEMSQFNTVREVEDTILKHKTNKAADKDGIAAELIKIGPEKLVIYVHRLIVRI